MNEIDIEAINNLLDAKDARIAQLEDLVASKDAEIAFLHEREITLARDGIETLNVVIDALRTVQPGREADHFVKESGQRIKTASPEDRPFIVNARIKAAASMIRDTPAATFAEPTGPDPLRYDVKTLNQKRAEAIAAHVQQTGKASIKSPEARAVLETVEHRKLDRKSVWRALKTAQGLLRATKDTVWGVCRLIVSPTAIGGGGDEDTVPRPRRDRTPWGG